MVMGHLRNGCERTMIRDRARTKARRSARDGGSRHLRLRLRVTPAGTRSGLRIGRRLRRNSSEFLPEVIRGRLLAGSNRGLPAKPAKLSAATPGRVAACASFPSSS